MHQYFCIVVFYSINDINSVIKITKITIKNTVIKQGIIHLFMRFIENIGKGLISKLNSKISFTLDLLNRSLFITIVI